MTRARILLINMIHVMITVMISVIRITDGWCWRETFSWIWSSRIPLRGQLNPSILNWHRLRRNASDRYTSMFEVIENHLENIEPRSHNHCVGHNSSLVVHRRFDRDNDELHRRNKKSAMKTLADTEDDKVLLDEEDVVERPVHCRSRWLMGNEQTVSLIFHSGPKKTSPCNG